ncbi:MAG: hypothetical protein ACYTXA_07200 [Nostoc sp.]
MSIPLVDHPRQEKLVTVADVSWEEFKGIGKYEEVNRSGFFPNLDPALLLQ